MFFRVVIVFGDKGRMFYGSHQIKSLPSAPNWQNFFILGAVGSGFLCHLLRNSVTLRLKMLFK